MLKCLTFVFASFLTAVTSAQVVNSLSPDRTGFYGHALDTLVSIVKDDKSFGKIYVAGADCALRHVPEKIQGILVEKIVDLKKLKKMGANEALFKITCIGIIRDEVKLTVGAWKQEGRNRTWLGEGAYEFAYYYDPDSKVYHLKKIKSGLVR